MNESQDRFLTMKEVRQRLNLSRTTVWRWVTERGLKAVKVGNVARIRETDLQAFLKRFETAGERAVESSQTQVTKSG
jgi:excisionase family DNA binding protein